MFKKLDRAIPNILYGNIVFISVSVVRCHIVLNCFLLIWEKQKQIYFILLCSEFLCGIEIQIHLNLGNSLVSYSVSFLALCTFQPHCTYDNL